MMPKFEVCFYLNLSRFIDNATQDDIDRYEIPEISGLFNVSVIKKGMMAVFKRYKDNPIAAKTQPCPLHKDFLKFINYSSMKKNDFEHYLPSGDYKSQHRYWNDRDENVFECKTYETLKTVKNPLQ